MEDQRAVPGRIRAARIERSVARPDRMAAILAVGIAAALAWLPRAAADCPEPEFGSFAHITEVPYGDLPDVAAIETMYGNFLDPWESSDTPIGPPPWEETEDYFCADFCKRGGRLVRHEPVSEHR